MSRAIDSTLLTNVTNQKLSSLLQGGSEKSEPAPSGWRNRLAALVPLALLVGFLALLGIVLGDRLIPARELSIESVVTVKSGGSQAATTQATGGDPFDAPMLFQASGWIEPDPLPVKATALVDGVVEEVKVLEGETVEKDQLLATLIDDDAKLNLRTAENKLASLKAQAAAHHGQIEVVKAEIATLKKQVAAAQAKRDELADQATRYQNLPVGSVPEREVAQARLQLKTQEAEVGALAASEGELKGKLQQLSEVANDFQARIAEAETEVARKQLALDRTRIESPVDGIVLSLHAVPGQKKMLSMDHHDSATVAILYQPDKLQARIDVPLAEAAQLAVGQPVRIRSNFLPDKTFKGQVTRIVGEADIQRNTLQAKVRIDNPDSRLRPEMLCRAEFLALSSEESDEPSKSQSGRVRIFAPQAALTEIADDSAKVWLLDESGDRVTQKSITLGTERRENFRLVTDGLKPGDRVVLDPPVDLAAGQRVKPRN